MSIAIGTRLHINLYTVYKTTSVHVLVLLSQNAQSDEKVILSRCTIGSFCPSHNMASRQSSSFDGSERTSRYTRDYHDGTYRCVIQVERTYEQVSDSAPMDLAT